MNNKISVKTFGTHLRNRNSHQSDGECSGQDFRDKHLKPLNNPTWWKGDEILVLDFEGVETLSPGWANEVFAYFARYPFISKSQFVARVKLENLSKVKLETISDELARGFDA